jgi:hypothetical protein
MVTALGHGSWLVCEVALNNFKLRTQGRWWAPTSYGYLRGHFTHDIESPWLSHFKHSHWWKRWSWSKFASPLRLRDQWRMWMQDRCKSVHAFLHGINWIMFYGHLDYLQNPPRGCKPNTKPRDHGTPNAHNHWFIPFYHAWGPEWLENHWNSIWLRDLIHVTSHYNGGSMTTLHDVGGVLGRPLDALFWALTISWSRLLARVWHDPTSTPICAIRLPHIQLNKIDTPHYL